MDTKKTIDWREELLSSQKFNEQHTNLLKNGPQSLAQAWILGALYQRWKKLTGYRTPEPPDCQSSFKEFEQSRKSL
tara:strand:+ start:1339 stop:1566 length:228 start_codon:yes stop_codon:yes gene_type:complete